jgi:hypothetical protein
MSYRSFVNKQGFRQRVLKYETGTLKNGEGTFPTPRKKNPAMCANICI